MVETGTLQENPQALSPRWGTIELLQVVSLSLIPFGAFLFPSGWSSLCWFFSILFFAIPFFLVRVPEPEVKSGPSAAGAREASPDAPKRVEPFHSSKNPGVYHIYEECFEGDNISIENKAPGTGGGKLCDRCEDLLERGGFR